MRATTRRIAITLAAAATLIFGGHAHAATATSQGVTIPEGSVDFWITLTSTYRSPATLTLDTVPTNGSLKLYDQAWAQIPWTGSITGYPYALYTFSPGYNGPGDSFRWLCSDSDGASGLATCSIARTNNTPPQSTNQWVTNVVRSARVYTYLSFSHPNDSYQPCTWTLVTAPTNGALEYYNSGYQPLAAGVSVDSSAWYYTSTGTSSGVDSFVWKMSDGIATSGNATVFITLASNTAPVANPQSEVTVVGAVRAFITLNKTHPNSDSSQPCTWTLITAPTNGALEYSDSGYQPVLPGTPVSSGYWYYTPSATSAGVDSFVWNMSDSLATSGTARCSITINGNHPPVTVDQSFTCPENSARKSLILSYTEADGNQTMVFQFLSAPAHGTLTTSAGNPLTAGSELTNTAACYYQPDADYAGPDAFTWNVCDGIATSATATVSITVEENNPPIITRPSQSLACLPNSTNSLSAFLGYTHADTGQTISFTLESAPTNGTLVCSGSNLETGSVVANNTWTYIPAPDYTGPDGFVWSVSDGTDSATGTLSITVATPAPPLPPVFRSGVKLLDGARTLALGTRIVNGGYDFAGPVYYSDAPRNNNMVVSAPELADWNNDGRMDLLVGQADGRVALFINKGTRGHPVFDGYEYVKLSTGRDIRTYLGGCVCQGGGPECPAPRVVDWNNDGRKDLILGQWSGPTYGMNLFVYLNVGADAAPVFDRKLACTLSSPSGYPTTLPFVTDWNGDGITDLISGDNPVWGSSHNTKSSNALLNIFLGTSNNHGPSTTVYSGNCWNYELFNWDEYNPSGSFKTTSPTLTTTNICPIGSRKSVVAADWDGSGRKHLITGMQDGPVYYSPNVGTANFPSYTNHYRLQAGGSNIVVGSVSKLGQNPAYGSQGNMLNQERFPAVNEARLAIGDLDGDGLLDLVSGELNGTLTVFYQHNPNPVAIDQRVRVLPNIEKNITLSARVDNGNSVTYSVLTAPTNGTLSGSAPNLSYLPAPGDSGTDHFTFAAIDGALTSRVAAISITVGPHSPVAKWTSPATGTATAVMNMDTSLDLVLTATDEGTEPLTYSIVTPPAHGTYSLSSNVFTYTPLPGYTGLDRFSYKANDGHQDSNPATVNLDVCVRAVNFQPPASPIPDGYRADTGGVFSVAHGYGWDPGLTISSYGRGRSPDPRLDTMVMSSFVATWTCALPNGNYWVSLMCGDSSATRGPQRVVLNGVQAVSNVTTVSTALSHLAGNIPVTITNGLLTLAMGGAGGETALDYIEIRSAHQPMGAATFVTEDASTWGQWKGVYGADGYKLITGLLSPRGSDQQVDYVVNSYYDFELLEAPSYAIISGPPNGRWGSARWKVWAFPSDDPRALQYPAPMLDHNRIAVAWHAANAGSTISCDLNFTDGQTHRVAVYCLAWGNSTWAQTMEVRDAGDGTILDSRVLSNFGGGKWLVWDLKGRVTIRATCTSGAAAISGFFFGSQAAPSITEHPMDDFVQTGQYATFSVGASGHPLHYQWQRSVYGGWWEDIPDANADSYTFATVSIDNGSEFRCVVTNEHGEAASYPAWLMVDETLPPPPVITSPLIVTCVFKQAFTYKVTALNNPTYFDAYMPPMAGSYDGIDTRTGVMTFNRPAYWNGYNTSWTENPGTLYIPFVAGNAGGEDFQILTLIINPTNAPVITSPLTATGLVDVPFTYAITATPAATLYSTWDLPPWLSLNTGTGVISGTPPPEAVGETNVTIRASNANGTGMARLTIAILGAPTITAQPGDVSVPVGQPAVFSVTATGDAPLLYQWTQDGVDLVNATNLSLTIPSTTYGHAGSYRVTVSNPHRSVTSQPAMLTITAGAVPPTILVQPTNILVAVAQPAVFTVAAAGTSPLAYQWRKDGTNIPGATGASHTLASADLPDAGSYSVTITNLLGSVTSSPAALMVSNNLAAWWKLDETSGVVAADSSGHSRTGVLQVTAAWTQAGQLGGALQLSGSNDRFSVTPALSLGSNSWTIAAWFTAPLPNTATWHNLVRAASGGDYLVTADASLNLGMYDVQTSGGFRTTGFNLGSLCDGWHHLAAVGSGNTTRFFIDGVYVGFSDRKGGKDVPAVGNHAAGGQRFANAIDDVRVYTRTLTASEILALASVPPVITTQPANQAVVAGQAAAFSVTASGLAPLSYQWLLDGGVMDLAVGNRFAVPFTFLSDNGGQFQVIVSNPCGSITSAVATLTVTNARPTVTVPAAADPSPATGATTVLTVGGADDGGDSNLTYTWTTNGAAPGSVSYSRNGNSPAHTTTATFTQPGAYSFRVIIEDDGGLAATSAVAVTVIQTLTTITVSPPAATLATNTTQPFTASRLDQFGAPMIGTCTWSVSGGGSIDAAGLFTAAASITGTCTHTVTAADGAVSGTADVTVAGGGWRMYIGFPGYIGRAETLTNFPARVVLGPDIGGSGFSYGSTLSPHGHDLRFTDVTGVTSLSHEIESWDPQGESHVWVRVPALPGNGSGAIWAHWGNAADSNQLACTTNGSTWTQGYQLVQHFTATGGTVVADSSPARRHANIVSSAYSWNSPGPAGRCLRLFSGLNDRVDLGTATNVSLSGGSWTASAWFMNLQPTTASRTLFRGNANDHQVIVQSGSSALGTHDNAGGTGFRRCGVASLPTLDGTWRQMTAVGVGGVTRMYVDGVRQGSAGYKSATDIRTINNYTTGGQKFAEYIDEVRISTVARSWDWVWAEYRTVADPDRFLQYGVAGPASIPQITASGGANGSLTPAGSLTVASGGTQAFTFTPDPWHEIGSVRVDGVDIGPAENHTFVNVTTWHSLFVEFAPMVAPLGTPLGWLAQFGWTDNFAAAELADSDLDGSANWHEYLSGTCPTNPLSAFGLGEAALVSGTNLVIRWSSATGEVYSIEGSTNLLGGFPFSLNSNIVATPALNCATVNVNQASQMFFRIRKESN